MNIEFDNDKNQSNQLKHGIGFDAVSYFEFAGAVIEPDNRRDYGENRYNAAGFIGDRLHVLTFTIRGDIIRVISLRKANQRERKKHAKTQRI